MQSTEKWLPVFGWEQLYEVSSLGRVRSLDRVVIEKSGMSRRHKGRIRKTPLSGGYPQISLCDGPRVVVTKVHRLVARAFYGERPPGMEVRHLDGNPANCAVENLKYGTSSENAADIVRHGNHAMANRTHCPKGHPYSPENTQVYDGRRNCRTCRLATKRAYNERKRLARIAALGGEIAGRAARSINEGEREIE